MKNIQNRILNVKNLQRKENDNNNLLLKKIWKFIHKNKTKQNKTKKNSLIRTVILFININSKIKIKKTFIK